MVDAQLLNTISWVPIWSNSFYFFGGLVSASQIIQPTNTISYPNGKTFVSNFWKMWALLTFILIATAIISTLHHLGTSKVGGSWWSKKDAYLGFEISDIALAIISGLVVIYFLFRAWWASGKIDVVLTTLVILLGLASVYFWFHADHYFTRGNLQLYDFYHSFWHVTSSLSILMALLEIRMIHSNPEFHVSPGFQWVSELITQIRSGKPSL